MIFLAFVGLAPFTFGYMLGVGLFVVLVHTAFMAIHGGQLPAVYAIFCSLMVVSGCLIGCCGAYAREPRRRVFTGLPKQAARTLHYVDGKLTMELAASEWEFFNRFEDRDFAKP